MSIYDEIAKGGRTNPLAAFLVGRENKRLRERQQQIDTLNEESQGVLNEFRQTQIDSMKAEPERRRAETEAERARIAVLITAIDASDVDPNKKNIARRLALAGQEENAVKLITADPKGVDAFTLSPGSVRYDSQGNILANNPKQSGDAGGFTLADGALRFDAAGNLIAENPKDPTSAKPSAAEGRIDRLKSIGLSEDQAIRIADGVAKLETDPAGGIVRYTDLQKALNGEPDAVTELPIQPAGGALEQPVVPQEETLYAQAGQATGPIQRAQNLGSVLLGAAGSDFIDDKTVAATQYFKAAENTIIRAFSLNPKFPIAEQKRISENIAIKPAVLDSERLMQTRMRAIDRFLDNEIKNLEFQASQPGASRESRTTNQQIANSMKQFRRQLGVPGESSGIRIISRRPANGE